MKLFEADCPQHLVTEMKLRERRNKERQEITDKEEEQVKNWILVMYGKAKLKGEKDHVKKVNKAEVESVWGTIF